MSKPAAERPLWVHQDRLNLPFPAVQGTALLLKARFLLSGMGRCVKFFSLREGFFFALLLIFPLWEAKAPAHPSQEAGCHKICFYIDPTFSHAVRKKLAKHRSRADILLRLPAYLPRKKISRRPSPVCRTGLLSRLPQGLDTSSPLPPPPPARTEKFPQAKTVCVGANSMGMFCPCHGAVPPHAGCLAAIRRSTTARDAPSCLATRMREGDFPHGKPPSSAS